MGKWQKRIVVAVVVAGAGYLGYGVFDAYRAGLFTRPDMPDGAFSLSYKNGLRGILVGVPDERTTRRYFSFPVEVPFYLEEAWSFCHPPSQDEQRQIAVAMSKRNWPGERADAVCKIEVDGKSIVRGVITTVPKV